MNFQVFSYKKWTLVFPLGTLMRVKVISRPLCLIFRSGNIWGCQELVGEAGPISRPIFIVCAIKLPSSMKMDLEPYKNWAWMGGGRLGAWGPQPRGRPIWNAHDIKVLFIYKTHFWNHALKIAIFFGKSIRDKPNCTFPPKSQCFPGTNGFSLNLERSERF